MKVINMEELVELIKSLTIEDIKIERELEHLDASSPLGEEYIIQPTGRDYRILIHGHQQHP